MALDIKELVKRAKKYVELEAHTKVLKAKFVEQFTLLGRDDVVITEKQQTRMILNGGSSEEEPQ
jgi:hypothetical protein